MPESGASFVPAPLSDVDSDPITETFAALIRAVKGFVVAGLDFSSDGTTAHISAGRSIVVTDADPPSAYYVKLTTTVDKALVNSATNWIYLTYDATLVVNQSGIDPANSIPLFRAVVAGGIVTSFTNLRSTTLDIQGKLKATALDLSSGELTNLGAPLANSSGARLQDVIDYFLNVGGIKNPVRMASTANLTLSGLQTIDAVVGASQNRVLAKNQTNPAENGIWVMLTTGWTRATDFDSSGDVVPGTLVEVSEGTANGGGIFGLDTAAPIVLGTTGLTFTRKDVLAHAGLTSAHGSTSAATPSRIVERDVNGNASMADGSSAGHIATKGQLDAAIASEAATRAAADGAEATSRAAADSAEATARSNGDAAAVAAAEAYSIQRANHTGTQTASTISNFDTQVHASRLDQFAAPTAPVSMGNQRLTDMDAPVAVADGVRLVDIGGAPLIREWCINQPGSRSKVIKATNNNGPAALGRAGSVIVMAYNEGTTLNVAISTDGGYTFTALTSPGSITASGAPGQISIFVQDASNFAIAYSNATTLVFAVTSNGGSTWTTTASTATTNLNTTSVTAVCVSLTTAFYTYTVSTTTVGYATTTNAGSSYTKGTVATETITGAPAVVATTDGATVYAFWPAATNKLRWSKTTNSGSSWAAAADAATDVGSQSVIAAIAMSTTAVIVDYNTNAATVQHKVLRTTNGSSFSTVLDYAGKLGHLSAAANTAILGYDGSTLHHIYTTAAITAGTGQNYNVHHAYSIDGGATWSVRSGMPFGGFGFYSLSTTPSAYAFACSSMVATPDYLLFAVSNQVLFPSLIEVQRRVI